MKQSWFEHWQRLLDLIGLTDQQVATHINTLRRRKDPVERVFD